MFMFIVNSLLLRFLCLYETPDSLLFLIGKARISLKELYQGLYFLIPYEVLNLSHQSFDIGPDLPRYRLSHDISSSFFIHPRQIGDFFSFIVHILGEESKFVIDFSCHIDEIVKEEFTKTLPDMTQVDDMVFTMLIAYRKSKRTIMSIIKRDPVNLSNDGIIFIFIFRKNNKMPMSS